MNKNGIIRLILTSIFGFSGANLGQAKEEKGLVHPVCTLVLSAHAPGQDDSSVGGLRAKLSEQQIQWDHVILEVQEDQFLRERIIHLRLIHREQILARLTLELAEPLDGVPLSQPVFVVHLEPIYPIDIGIGTLSVLLAANYVRANWEGLIASSRMPSSDTMKVWRRLSNFGEVVKSDRRRLLKTLALTPTDQELLNRIHVRTKAH